MPHCVERWFGFEIISKVFLKPTIFAIIQIGYRQSWANYKNEAEKLKVSYLLAVYIHFYKTCSHTLTFPNKLYRTEEVIFGTSQSNLAWKGWSWTKYLKICMRWDCVRKVKLCCHKGQNRRIQISLCISSPKRRLHQQSAVTTTRQLFPSDVTLCWLADHNLHYSTGFVHANNF